MSKRKGRKWKPGQAEKFRATMAARRKANQPGSTIALKPAKAASDTRRKDAIVYLRHAAKSLHRALRTGKTKEIDRSHLLAMLALKELEDD